MELRVHSEMKHLLKHNISFTFITRYKERMNNKQFKQSKLQMGRERGKVVETNSNRMMHGKSAS